MHKACVATRWGLSLIKTWRERTEFAEVTRSTDRWNLWTLLKKAIYETIQNFIFKQKTFQLL
jgi:hypothetical protein